jgi:hypothetical protein
MGLGKLMLVGWALGNKKAGPQKTTLLNLRVSIWKPLKPN